jgi:hypothetical protein
VNVVALEKVKVKKAKEADNGDEDGEDEGD